jgi:FAD/FMN-containing dehydrogenase
VVNDVSGLNRTRVAGERRPRGTDDVQVALREWSGAVCVGGGRYSMGGQIAHEGALHLDMRLMNQVVAFDPSRRTLRVQAGMTWRDVQDAIDPHGLAVAIMQSYSNFTVGGSVGVNCHGRYVGRGPIAHSIHALQLVTASGDVLELTRDREEALFRAAFGGYGGLGVITEVEISLDENTRIERAVVDVPLEYYPDYFRRDVLGDSRMVLHNADLRPPRFDVPRAVSWFRTEQPLTRLQRLVPRDLDYKLEKNAIWAISELPGGSWVRERIVDRKLLKPREVVWRNHEASLDAASLEPRTRHFSTYLLQEYFVPVERFVSFARAMSRILQARNVNALNVSIRHSPADQVSLLKWAPTDVFSFVLYYKQRTGLDARRVAGVWTRELIEAVLTHGGRYYLPYRLDATPEQFARAYPEATAFAALKRRIDPTYRFRNRLWDKYLVS